MKLTTEPAGKDSKGAGNCGAQPERPAGEPATAAAAAIPEGFRRLKWDELVCDGDFVADEHRLLEPWEGPSGFRADAFLKPIYRTTRAG